MKWWHSIGLAIGILLLIGGVSTLIVTMDNPQYASGEAIAMVERVYHWYDNSADLYKSLVEEYLGRGVWEVKSSSAYSSTYGGEQAVFRVYEETNTAQICNLTAWAILNRQEQLEQQKTKTISPVTPPPTSEPRERDPWGLGPYIPPSPSQ